jgi:hypothetical protein
MQGETRERVLRYASLIAALAVVVEWIFGAWIGASIGRATLTLVGGVALVALAWKGSSYGRFGGMGFTFALIVLGVMRYVVDDYWNAPSRHRIVGALDVVLLGVAFLGFTLGAERSAVSAGSHLDRSLRALFGALIGVMVAVMGGRPALVFCAPGSEAWQVSTCHRQPGCALIRGCEPVPGRCVASCEVAETPDACLAPCAWQSDRCTHPSCELDGDACAPAPACRNSEASPAECTNVCSANDDSIACTSFRGCAWVACTGIPEPCSSYSYEQCPFDIGCERVSR